MFGEQQLKSLLTNFTIPLRPPVVYTKIPSHVLTDVFLGGMAPQKRISRGASQSSSAVLGLLLSFQILP